MNSSVSEGLKNVPGICWGERSPVAAAAAAAAGPAEGVILGGICCRWATAVGDCGDI